MQKFIVPQFIDVESRILGPVTIRQFGTAAIGLVFLFAAYKLADFTLFLVLAAVIVIVTIVIGFVKINGQPFHIFVLNFVLTLKRPMLRVWKKVEPVAESRRKGKNKKEEKVFIPHKQITQAKLAELALIIDTGGIYKGEQNSSNPVG